MSPQGPVLGIDGARRPTARGEKEGQHAFEIGHVKGSFQFWRKKDDKPPKADHDPCHLPEAKAAAPAIRPMTVASAISPAEAAICPASAIQEVTR